MSQDEEVKKNNMKTVHILVVIVAVIAAVSSIITRDGRDMLLTVPVFALGLVVGAIYFIPSYIAASRNHSSRVGITVLNALGGGLLGIGWIAAIVWAVTGGKTGDSAEKTTVAHQPSGAASLSEQISRLKELHEQGALSDEEYQAAKAKLLN